ncbi:uncharacterized protein LOC124287213 [Haliotis rubra]|uniref:uncharacterized protein LOC124287213 n=1 Tax=Haliotis rubra TaxID=36100 RepID=UPI001EE505E9|nr:uncharacterized protein LOC124287213 [Haliotis rubra]
MEMSDSEDAILSGHSGKVTTATRLFGNQVDEQLVMERTGNISSAVRLYKRTSVGLQKEISDMLQPPAPGTKATGTSSPPSKKIEIETADNQDAADEQRIKITCTNSPGNVINISL